MTEYKAFSIHDTEPESSTRAVAAVLVVSESVPWRREDDSGRKRAGAIIKRAIDTHMHVEADRLVIVTDSPELAEIVESYNQKRVELVCRQPHDDSGYSGAAGLAAGATCFGDCSHNLVWTANLALMRASTLSEAVRLLKMRTDITSIAGCTRISGPVWDRDGHKIFGPRSGEPYAWRSVQSMCVVPSARQGHTAEAFAQPHLDPYLFEISQREAFALDSAFAFDLAESYLAAKLS